MLILAMVVIQRPEWSMRPGSESHYTSYRTPSKSRSRGHSAFCRQDTEDRDADVEMKQVKYEPGACVTLP